MKRRDGASGQVAEQWEVKVVDVKVKNVELSSLSANPVKHQHIIWNGINDMGVETQRNGCATH